MYAIPKLEMSFYQSNTERVSWHHKQEFLSRLQEKSMEFIHHRDGAKAPSLFVCRKRLSIFIRAPLPKSSTRRPEMDEGKKELRFWKRRIEPLEQAAAFKSLRTSVSVFKPEGQFLSICKNCPCVIS